MRVWLCSLVFRKNTKEQSAESGRSIKPSGETISSFALFYRFAKTLSCLCFEKLLRIFCEIPDLFEQEIPSSVARATNNIVNFRTPPPAPSLSGFCGFNPKATFPTDNQPTLLTYLYSSNLLVKLFIIHTLSRK